MSRHNQRRLVLILAAAAMFPLCRVFMCVMEKSMCAFDPCRPVTWADVWWIPTLQVSVLLLAAVLPSAPPTPNSEDQQ